MSMALERVFRPSAWHCHGSFSSWIAFTRSDTQRKILLRFLMIDHPEDGELWEWQLKAKTGS